MKARTVLVALMMLAAVFGGREHFALAQDSNVPVRIGSHPTYDRVVFDWPNTVNYRVDQQGNAVTITFDQPAGVSEGQLLTGLARVATTVTATRSDTAVTVQLQLADGVTLRHFRTGPKIVLDFARGDATAAPAPMPMPTTGATAAARPSAPAAPPPSRTDARRPWETVPLSGTPSAAPPVPMTAPINPAPTVPLTMAPPPAAAAPPVRATATPPWAQAPSVLGPAAAPTVPSRANRNLTPEELAAATAEVQNLARNEAQILEQLREQSRQLATQPPTRLAPPPREPAAGAAPGAAPAPGANPSTAAPGATAPRTPAERSAAFTEAQQRRQADRLAVAQQRALGAPIPVVRAEGQGIRVKWPDPVTAAAFTRGPYVFLVFNMRANMDLSALRNPPADDLVGTVTTIPSEGTTLRLSPPTGTYYAIRSEGNDWVVEMTRRPRRPDAPAEVATRNESDPNAARVVVTLRGGQAVMTQRDPEVGDEIKVVPTAVPGAGIEVDYDFPQFKILQSAQGLVVKPGADGVVIRPLGPFIEIYSNRGTLVSSGDAPRGAASAADDDEATPRIFNFTEWKRDDGRPYLERRRDLERNLTAGTAAQRNPARLALARFLFANGNTVEADGVLDVMVQQQPAVGSTRLYRSLKGGTSLILGNIEAAGTNLRHATLDREPELAVWRTALYMAEGDIRRAIEEMQKGPDLSRSYPAPYANRLGLALSEALIELGDIPAARDRLEAVFDNNPTESEESQGRYLRGRLAILEGRPDEAIALWTALERGPPSPARVLAALALVDLQLKEGRITQEQAAARIERMRFVWRGDDIEFAVLRRLGELDIASGNVRKGLRSLRDLVALKPDSRDVTAVTRQMNEAFQKYFLEEGGADKLSPIAAIGMYNEFKHLVENTPVEDAMTRNIADRLIKVDLLDQAADLLEGLVNKRLTGEAKAEAGARLAFTRLLDRKPAEALRAIEETDSPDLSPELVRDRRRLASRALADLDRAPEGLALIATDTTPEADLLRAEINWKIGAWAAAGEALGRLAGVPPTGTAPMPEEQATLVLRYAAALALAGDQTGLDGVRRMYGPAMARGPYNGVFAVLASDAAGQMPDVQDIQRRLSSTAPFQTFLAAYRQRFGAPPRG